MIHIGFRVDATNSIGGGHFWRCYNLALSLKKKNKKIFFLSRNLNKSFLKKIKKEKFYYLNLKKKIPTSMHIKEYDFLKTEFFIKKFKINVLFIDNYSIGNFFKKNIKRYLNYLIVIDDHINRSHNADLYINNNFLTCSNKKKIKKLNPKSKLFLGLKYFILNKNFYKYKSKARLRNKIKKIFVFFGSGDHSGETIKFIKAIKAFSELKIFILIGKLNKKFNKIKLLAKKNKNVRLFSDIHNKKIIPLILKSDLGFGSGGVNLIERLFLGLPSVVVSTANNQMISVKNLSKIGLIKYLGDKKKINVKKIREAIKELIVQDNLFKNFSNKVYYSSSYIKTENYLSNKLNLIISRIE